MFRTAFVAAFVAVASAASWPMITVNSAGNIVLNSPTKAGSFQLNAVTVTAAPTSSGTSSRSTVTALDADTDAFIVNVPSSPATSAGYKLPTATEGRTIRFYNSGSGKGAFTIWSDSTSVFFDGTSSTTIDVLSTTSYVVATATSSTNWVISQNALASNGLVNKNYRLAASLTISSNAVTLTAAQVAGGILDITPTDATTVTTPTASSMTSFDINSQNADAYEFSITNNGAIAAASPSTDLTVTLAAGTGFTIPSDTRKYIVPGQTRTYIAYRTSSSAWTIVQKSQYTITPSTVVIGAQAAPTLNTLATPAPTLGTVHGLVFQGSANAITYTLTTSIINFGTFTNNYAKLGDDCIFAGYSADAAVANDGVSFNCRVTADNTITVTVGTFAAATVAQPPIFRIIKN